MILKPMSKKHKDAAPQSWIKKLNALLSREPKNKNELIHLLNNFTKHSSLTKETLGMIENLLKFSDRYVGDVMIPRPQMVVIDHTASFKEVLPIVKQSRHSRFPVVADNRDKVIGILLAKDLLQFALMPSNDQIKITELIRPAIFIPKSKRLNTLLQEFRLNHYHMAIVVDEYGGVDGLVTIEDILEEIVGDIADEYDVEEDNFIKSLPKREFLVNALTPIHDFNHYFNVNFDSQEYDTIGGLITQQLNRLPQVNETFDCPPFKVTVLKADKRRVYLFKLKRVHV
jgi:magnesium and cobalt transporter